MSPIHSSSSSAAGTLIRVDVTMPDYVAIGLETSCEEIPVEVDA